MDKSNEFQSPQVQNLGHNATTKNKGCGQVNQSPPIQNPSRNATTKQITGGQVN
jgi:hypothetical protein